MSGANTRLPILVVLAVLAAVPATADFVINDDLIVDGSACIGFDCVNGESFGFDTIRLKENNLRIRADDTSVAASYPREDWQITFNDSANGGLSRFAIDDLGPIGSGTVFTIEAGAGSNALYVDDGGRVGFGTSTPSVELHTIDGDTPTLRLQQDGSSGFAPQTWDVAGNETNFFIRDVTNGSQLPFRIRPDAPTSSIFIDVDGDVGLGTSSPGTMTAGNDASLHVYRTDGDASILVEETTDSGTTALAMLELRNNGPSRIILENTNNNQTWDFRQNAGGDFAIVTPDAAGTELLLDEDGNLTIQGEITTSGSCSIGCDRVFGPDYEVESIDAHAAAMWQNSFLPAVGPTVEGGPFNLTEKTGGMLNELEKAHIYIERLHRRLTDKEAAVAALDERLSHREAAIATLERRLEALERALSATP